VNGAGRGGDVAPPASWRPPASGLDLASAAYAFRVAAAQLPGFYARQHVRLGKACGRGAASCPTRPLAMVRGGSHPMPQGRWLWPATDSTIASYSQHHCRLQPAPLPATASTIAGYSQHHCQLQPAPLPATASTITRQQLAAVSIGTKTRPGQATPTQFLLSTLDAAGSCCLARITSMHRQHESPCVTAT